MPIRNCKPQSAFIPESAIAATALICAVLCFKPALAFAQTDEIQVYDGSIAESGKFTLTIHSNFTPRGAKTPAFPGGLIPDKSFNGVTEWAYGVTKWFEAGLYLPLYSISKDRGATINGGKFRLLFTVPNAEDRKFFYGANFEFSYNSGHWDPRPFTSEIRPIVGLHLRPVDIIVNPILDNSYIGGFGNFEFVPAARVAYNLSSKWEFAIEEYGDVGALHEFLPVDKQSHQLYGVVDYGGKKLEVEAGIGFGLTPSSDKVNIKLMLLFK
jgi:hypothetical protein